MHDTTKSLRFLAYGLLTLTSLASVVARISTVESKSGATPFLSANDRSRWCTIRSLVEFGTYEIDRVVLLENGKRNPDWYSIDVVKHRGPDGREHYYSSKPTLLPTLLAGQYWLVRQITGASLAGNPRYVGRIMLVLTNALPLALYFGLCVHLAERYGRTDWSRLTMVAAAAWATFLTTFAVTLNNHLIAAISGLVAVVATSQIWERRAVPVGWFFLAGAAAAFTAANELPALSLLVACGVAACWCSPRRALLGFAPPALLIAAAALGTNYLAHGTWKPAYSQRSDGRLLGTVPATPEATWSANRLPPGFADVLRGQGHQLGTTVEVTPIRTGTRWTVFDVASQRRYTLFERSGNYEIREGGNWYEYEGTYWRDGAKRGVDRGEPQIGRYFLHTMVGHHGLFSLTPIWLFALAGSVLALKSPGPLRGLAALTAALSITCIVFFTFRPLADRNYGGVSCGFRWLFWLIPLWLVCLLPMLDRIAEKRGWRWAFGVALAVSVFSASYTNLNPWSHPWIYDYWFQLGWINE